MAARMADLEYNKRKQWLEDGFHWCTKCEQKLSVLMFSFSKSAMFGYFNWCKLCQSKKRKGDEQNNRKQRLRARSFMKHYKQLIGGQCAKCKYSKTQASLEFHHVSRGEKKTSMSHIISNGSYHEEIMHELDKCILLCRNCHMEFESSAWICEFIKADVGYKIREGSVIEFPDNYWMDEGYAEKILSTQIPLFEVA